MFDINSFLNENILSIVVVLLILVLVLGVISIFAVLEVIKLKKRYEQFTGGNRHAEYTLETQFDEYHKSAKFMEERYSVLEDMIRDIDKNMEKCIQKVGVVRYNPFDEVGGDLSYAIALLDSHDNGVILNGIHSRTGSFTYAKPVELGVSEYVLSMEESQALEKALTEGYVAENRQEILDKLDASLPKNYAESSKKRKGRRKAEKNIEKTEEKIDLEEEMEADELTEEAVEDVDVSAEIAAIFSSIDNKDTATSQH